MHEGLGLRCAVIYQPEARRGWPQAAWIRNLEQPPRPIWSWSTNPSSLDYLHEAYLCLTFAIGHSPSLSRQSRIRSPLLCPSQLASSLAAILRGQSRVHAGADTTSRVPVGHLHGSVALPAASERTLTTQRAVLRLPAILSMVTSTRILVPLSVSRDQNSKPTQAPHCSSSCRSRYSGPAPFQAARGVAQKKHQ